jgi:hypothetical protein
MTYQIVSIGNSDASPATLPSHIVFDRCYVHGRSGENHRRGIEMDGAAVAVVDSYISDFQEAGADSQSLAAWNTTGPVKIVNNYIEAATENVLFGGADNRSAELLPADIEIRNNHFFKPLSRIGTRYPIKNLLEFKTAKRVLVTGNTFQNSPAGAYALLITPRNNGGTAPWSVTADIAVIGNAFINVGGGFNILGRDYFHPSEPTTRVLIRDNVLETTTLNGGSGRALVVTGNGGSDWTIDHNTIITAVPSTGNLMIADTTGKITNFTFTNNLVGPRQYGFGGRGVTEGIASLDQNFTNWVFSKNVIVAVPARFYPSGNFYPNDIAGVRFMNYAGGNYALAADSPYKSAGTDGKDIGADVSAAPSVSAIVPNPPGSVVVR